MPVARSLFAALSLMGLSTLAQAAGPFQSELLHLDLPQPSTSAVSRQAGASKAAPTPALAAPAGRTRAEVLAELREARARGELDHAAAEVGLQTFSRQADTRLAARGLPAAR